MRDPTAAPRVTVRLTQGPIVHPSQLTIEGAGAVVTFEGRVRPSEPVDGESERPISGLQYQVYEPMTSQELLRLGQEYADRYGVLAVAIEHSHGFVKQGECSFVLQVVSRHRAEAIAMMDTFIAEMKRRVPIWKVPAFSE